MLLIYLLHPRAKLTSCILGFYVAWLVLAKVLALVCYYAILIAYQYGTAGLNWLHDGG
jgi:hypothetical protein